MTKRSEQRGDCSHCVVSTVCLPRGVAGLMQVIYSVCAHCAKVRLSKNKKKPIDLECLWFDSQYKSITRHYSLCKECEIEVKEMHELAGGKDKAYSARGSTVRRKKR
jgi:hypothetical protein